jgi:hypothetical protein
MSKWRLVLMVAVWSVVFVLWGCGNKYTYSFTENGCETGEHSFGSKEEMCTALQNEDLNNTCAPGSREDYFKSQACTGTFTRH